MSTPPMPMVQVFAPDGTLGDIPYDKLHDALGAGAKIARKVQAPDGTPGYVPADRINEALKAGAKPLPIDLSDADGGKKGGFWSNASSAAKNAVSGLLNSGGPTLGAAAAGQGVAQAGQMAADDIARQQEGRSGVYRAAAPIAQTLVPGLNPRAMEQAANQGDTAGVLGQAAVPAALAMAPLAGEAALRGGQNVANAAGSALSPIKPQVQATADFLMHPEQIPGKAISKLADLIPSKPEYPGASLPSYEDYAANRGAEMNKARAMQDIQMRREATAQAKANVAKPLSPVYGPPSPSPEQLAQGVKLSDLVGEKPSGITVVPEPRAPFAGETPNYMASVPRDTLQELAMGAKPGAAKQMQQLGQQVLYAPSGVGYGNVRSSVPLSDLLKLPESASSGPAAVQGVPRDAYADMAANASPQQAAALQSKLSELRQSLSATGQAQGAPLRNLLSPSGEASPGLHPAAQGGMAVPKTSSGISLSKGEDLGPGLGTEHTIHTPDGQRIGSVTVEPKADGVLHVNWLGGDLAGKASRADVVNALKQEYPGTTKITYDRRRLAKGADAATTEPREMNVGSGS